MSQICQTLAQVAQEALVPTFAHQQALEIQQSVFGADHPMTIDTRKRLHALQEMLNKTKETPH